MNRRIKHILTKVATQHPGVGDNGVVRIAAAIVYKRHIISTGINSYKTHPLMCETNGYRPGQIYLHAETDAIRNALRLISKEQLKQCFMYIVRVKRPCIASNDWVYGLAKPCPGCEKTVKSYGIREIIWTEDESEILDIVV